MKNCVVAITNLMGVVSLWAAPVVSSSEISQETGNRAVTVSYVLGGGPGIVTMDIQTNTLSDASGEWVSIGVENLSCVVGDMFKYVSTTGKKTASWRPDKAWPGRFAEKGTIRAVVTAWPTNTPPDYMAVPLDGESSFRYFAKGVPGGATNREYKTKYLLMRKVPVAGVTWKMGSAEDGPDKKYRAAGNELQHAVSISEDFYLSVFETTLAQHVAVGNNVNTAKQFAFGDGSDNEIMPVNGCSYASVRGSDYLYTSTTPSYAGHNVSPSCFIQKFRNKTGVPFDLPSEAEWEYACRAGVGTPMYVPDADYSEATARRIAWCGQNSSQGCSAMQPHPVGGLEANQWGFYDMLGNVAEWVLDPSTGNSYYSTEEAKLNPHAPVPSSITMIYRGHYYATDWMHMRASAKGDQWRSYDNAQYGYRLWAPAFVNWE